MLIFTLNRHEMKFRGLDCKCYEILPLTKVKGIRTCSYDMQLSCPSNLVLGESVNLIWKILYSALVSNLHSGQHEVCFLQSKKFCYLQLCFFSWNQAAGIERSSGKSAKDHVFHLGLLGHALNWSLVSHSWLCLQGFIWPFQNCSFCLMYWWTTKSPCSHIPKAPLLNIQQFSINLMFKNHNSSKGYLLRKVPGLKWYHIIVP